MKTINTYINEKLRLTLKRQYSCQPKDFWELREIIIKRIKDEGTTCDLNDIDTSKITVMTQLFNNNYYDFFKDFNGDISMWDVSNVKSMRDMFNGCEKFNCDLSKWNVSKVKDMSDMFYGCKKFNQDLDSWNVSNVKNMYHAFKNCPTTPTWYDRKQNDNLYI